jgi:hypothetical protein
MFRAFTPLSRRSFSITGVAETEGAGEAAAIDPELVKGEAEAVLCGGGGVTRGAVSVSWAKMSDCQPIVSPRTASRKDKGRETKSIGIPTVFSRRRHHFAFAAGPG